MTARRAGWIYIALALLVVGFHLALIFGAPWGGLTSAGKWPGVLPAEGRVVSAASAVIMLVFIRAVAERAGLARQVFPRWAIWVVAACTVLGTVANALTPVSAERAVWLPLLLVQLACVIRLLRGPVSP